MRNSTRQGEPGAPGRTRTCNPRLSIPTTVFTAPFNRVCGLDYLFVISDAARIVSTEPCDSQMQILFASSDHSWVCLPSVLHSNQICQDPGNSTHRYLDNRCNTNQLHFCRSVLCASRAHQSSRSRTSHLFFRIYLPSGT